MDIDSPPANLPTDPYPQPHSHLDLPEFSASFPLPFRVLFLIGLAIFLWASNLHILHLLGLDTAWIFDFRDTPPVENGVEAMELQPRDGIQLSEESGRPASGKLYGPVYKLGLIYSGWVGAGWFFWRAITQGDIEKMEAWRGLVGFVAIGAAVGAIAPWRGVGQRERAAFRRLLKRIFLGTLNSPVFFADVILADIITSFAKVLGDLWISACQIWNGGITHGRVAQTGLANHITLFMVCLPYLLRLKQCLFEYYQSGGSASRHLANACKYFSAFPVILFSAAQKAKVYELALESGQTMQEYGNQHSRWYGEHIVFRLWLLAVVINSLYSFWWDIQRDFGLSLCDIDTWIPPRRADGRRANAAVNASGGNPSGILRRVTQLWGRNGATHHRSPAPTPSGHIAESTPLPSNLNMYWTTFGLRQTLLLPDPLVYHLFALIDLVLRFTWSLKLSSHLHTISEIESGVFLMEALELIRRWMWVFVRVEYEAVKKGEAQRLQRTRGAVIWENGENGEIGGSEKEGNGFAT